MIKLLLTNLLLLFCTVLTAQSLVVTKTDGTDETFPFTDILSMKFQQSDMILYKNDGGMEIWNIDDVSYYSFDESVSTEDFGNQNNWQVLVYPNPTSNQVRIKVDTPISESVTVSILDSKGAIVAELFSGTLEQNQEITWDVKGSKDTQSGTYICLIQTPDQRITRPIIVQ